MALPARAALAVAVFMVLLTIVGTKTKKPGGFAAICALVLPVVVLDIVYAKRCSADRRACHT